MLNKIWGFMIIIGIFYACLVGKTGELSTQTLESAQEAISLCITMMGIMSFWVGLMEIASKSGLVHRLTRLFRPFLFFLFPTLKNEEKALEYLSLNIITNLLGLGWACTPFGLKAMKELRRIQLKRDTDNLEKSREGYASNEMCNFLILNISSLQLIPITIITYRSKYGSVNPSAILMPAILATTASTLAGILFILLFGRVKKPTKISQKETGYDSFDKTI